MEATRCISVVTPVYHSQRWLPGYFKALAALEIGEDTLEIIIVDNSPAAMSLEEYIALAGDLQLKVLSNDKNEGFAKACNRGAREASGDFLLFLNVDTEIAPDCAAKLRDRLLHDPGCAIAEARQSPMEHPKFYWPGTGRVDWSSACCMLMRRSLFIECGGFDEIFFMYGEDVDLSFRLRDRGYRLAYVRSALCTHFDEDKDTSQVLERTYNAIRSSILLRARYSSSWHLLTGLWLELTRTILRRRGRGRTKALLALRDGLLACPRLLAQRFASTDYLKKRLFQDQGGFTLHYRFPEREKKDRPKVKLTDDSFTVVIATENRDFLVEPLIESLLHQMDELSAGELIVVDHGPIVGAADGLAERFRPNERFRLIDHPHGSAADAKNAGIRAAKGGVVIFLHDSAIPNESFLLHHMQCHEKFDVVQGPSYKPWPVAGSPFRKYVRDERERRESAYSEDEATLPWDELSSENLSVKRSLLEGGALSSGYFNRYLWSDEAADIELGQRLHEQNTNFHRFAHLGTLSRERPRFRAFLADNFTLGYAAAQAAEHSKELACGLGNVTSSPKELLRRLFTLLFVVTPLSIPAFCLDLILPPRLRLNPIARWWFHTVATTCQSAGHLWRKTFGGPAF